MDKVKEESKLLASLVVFRELYDKQKNIYGVIAEFVKEIITTNGLWKFTANDIKELLNNTFVFSIPEAVVNTAIKRLNFLKKDGYYIVQNMPDLNDRNIGDLQELNQNSNAEIISALFSYIEEKRAAKLSEEEKTKVVRSFCSFLLDDTNTINYSEYISGFTIENKYNENFKKSLNKIREGVILYSGINYSNLGEIGSWQTNLTIYLDTEILFNFAGYNGKLYKSLFDDFFGYVKEINNIAGKVIVKLEYFEEVKKEIDEFFRKAEDIVTGRDGLHPHRAAMNSVVNGCQSPSDVLSKKAEFYRSLKINGITESERNDYYATQNHEYNIIDPQIIQDFLVKFKVDVTENLNFLNYVNIRRKKEFLNSFENIGYILLTGTSLTLKIAFDEKINPDKTVPLATNLNWITNRFWFKLNKGFGNGNFPASFDVITKAQMVLSSVLNKSVGEKYNELNAEFKKGKITEETAKYCIVELKSQVMNPEDIELDDVPLIYDALSESSLEKYITEKEFSNNETVRQAQENVKLKKELSMTENVLAQLGSTHIDTSKRLLESYKENLEGKKGTIERLRKIKEIADRSAAKKLTNLKIVISIVAVIGILTPVILTIILGVDILSIITWILFLIGFVYSIMYGKKWEWNINFFFSEKEKQYQTKKYQELEFDVEYFSNLHEEVNELEKDIEKVKEEHFVK